MQRGRILLLVGLLLLVIIGGAFLLLVFGSGLLATFLNIGGGVQTPPDEPAPQQVATVQVAIALQNIDIGTRITPEMVGGASPLIGLVPWPRDAVLPTAYIFDGQNTTLNDLVDLRTRIDIRQGELILTSSVVENLYETSRFGSAIAEQIQPGQVGIALPLNRLLGLNHLLEPGDFVNVLVAFTIRDVDEDFQSALPNISVSASLIDPSAEDAEPIDLTGGSAIGRLDTVAAAPFAFLIGPSEPQRPRLISQQIVQNARVLAVGSQNPFEAPTPTPLPEQEGDEPPPVPLPPDAVLLSVTPEDSVALNWLMFSRAYFTLTLRSIGDSTLVNTTSVSLETIINRYAIEIPLPLPYATDPALYQLQPPQLLNDPLIEPIFVAVPPGDVICLGPACR